MGGLEMECSCERPDRFLHLGWCGRQCRRKDQSQRKESADWRERREQGRKAWARREGKRGEILPVGKEPGRTETS